MWCDFGANLVQHFIGRYSRYSRYRTKSHDKATISHDITRYSRYQTVLLKLQEIITHLGLFRYKTALNRGCCFFAAPCHSELVELFRRRSRLHFVWRCFAVRLRFATLRMTRRKSTRRSRVESRSGFVGEHSICSRKIGRIWNPPLQNEKAPTAVRALCIR